MAYTHTYPLGLGITASEILSTAQAAAKVVQDPALKEVTCHVMRLNAVTEGRDPGRPCPRKVYTAAAKRKGIGLHLATKPLRAVVWAKQHPAVAIGISVAAVGAIYGIGYLMGKMK